MPCVRRGGGAWLERVQRLRDVYRSMGGGWIDIADPLAPAAGAPPLDKRMAEQPKF